MRKPLRDQVRALKEQLGQVQAANKSLGQELVIKDTQITALKAEEAPRVRMLEQALQRRNQDLSLVMEARDQWKEGATLLFEAMVAMGKARRADRALSRVPSETDQVRP